MFKAIMGFCAFTVGVVAASLWMLYYLAFNEAKCTGINYFAFTGLLIFTIGTIFISIYLTFVSTDWLNDWLAARAVTKSQTQTNKLLTEQARTLVAQANATRKMLPNPPPGGLAYDPDVWEELPEG